MQIHIAGPSGLRPQLSFIVHRSRSLFDRFANVFCFLSLWMSGISYTYAFLLGAFFECVMCGIFASLFIAACYVQWERFSKGQELNRLMVFATVFFGSTVTTNLVISLFVSIRAILHNPPGVAVYLSPDLQYATKGIVRFMILQSQATVADMIIIYRMYHIYDRNPFVCIIPSITTAGLFAVGCGLADGFRHPTAPSYQKGVGGWTTSSFCLTIFNSLFLTVAISFKLWQVHRETTRAGIHMEDSIILRAIKVLIESAALWTTFAVMNFFTSLTESNLVHTILMMTSPALGISFCLIIVRLGHVIPEAREETWHSPMCTPTSRASASDRVAFSFPQVKIRRDVTVYVSESEEFPTRASEPQKEGYVDSSGDLPKIFLPSLSFSAPA